MINVSPFVQKISRHLTPPALEQFFFFLFALSYTMLRLSRTLVRLPKPTHILTRRSLTTTVAQKVFSF